jgi:riboflavin synthase
MFTGIVKGKGTIESVDKHTGLFRICVGLPAGAEIGLERGASVSVDGVCLTVTELQGSRAYFDVMQESLTRTTLDEITQGAIVNIERAAKDGAEIGGHPLSGHIDCTATIVRVDTPHNNHVVTFEVPAHWMRYIFPKGYIGLNGTSLTIADVNKANRTFDVWFIPETLQVTTFGEKRVGDLVNLEVERGTQVVVDTMRDFLEERLGKLLPAFESLLEKSGMSAEHLIGDAPPALPSPKTT